MPMESTAGQSKDCEFGPQNCLCLAAFQFAADLFWLQVLPEPQLNRSTEIGHVVSTFRDDYVAMFCCVKQMSKDATYAMVS